MEGYSIKRELQAASRWYPRQVAWVRIGVGVWLLLLTAMLYGSGHGGQWGWLLVPTAVLHFYLAYRLLGAAGKNRDSRIRPH
ncbi:MAG: hypothetical protein ACR2NR_15255 [Solirubrobacteraceae bacterium]